MKLSLAVDLYVRARREEGAMYLNGEEVLRSLCRRLDDPALEELSVASVMSYLENPCVSPRTRTSRQCLVNRFLRFWTLRGAIPAIALPIQSTREVDFVPYVYSQTELAALFAATISLKRSSPLIDARTLRIFLLTLYATGGFVNEVVRMKTSQVDLRHSRVTLNGNRRIRKRCIPICPDLKNALTDYMKEKGLGRMNDVGLFQTVSGDELNSGYLNASFQRLLRVAGITRRDQFKRTPRMQDLRATFAVHRLSSWIKGRSDLNRMLPALSAYMGYSGLSTAGRYLDLIPERFLADLRKLSPNRNKGNWRNNDSLMTLLTEL